MSEWEAILRTIAALVAGGVIGLERSYHGRAAGLRTYALVSFGSALLVAGGQYELFGGLDRGDVTRIIQGIVTGIGFLGAGVIVKEGFVVRGLTTAASIWVASALGVVLGAGSYWMGAAAMVVTLVALALLRHFEARLPSQTFVHFEAGVLRDSALGEDQLRRLIEDHGFAVNEFAYQLDGNSLAYQAVIWTTRHDRVRALERAVLALPEVVTFRISPRRD
jgi:putative Mg2+ transporter-C (MgtC) family protein